MLEIDGEKVRGLVSEMAEIEGITGDGVLRRIEETLGGDLFGDRSRVKVVAVTGLGGERELREGVQGKICLRSGEGDSNGVWS